MQIAKSRRAAGLFWFAGSVAMTLAGAPAHGQDNQQAQQACQSDAMIVFDASGSMGTTDRSLKRPRIARVKQAMSTVIPDIAQLRRLGLIVYGEGEYNDCNSIELRLKPTANAADMLLAEIAGIDPRGRTPLTQSVVNAAEALAYREREAVIVLLTDGEETCGGDPCKAAAVFKKAAKNLTIHVIGYRTETEGYFTARCMADLTGGQYLSVGSEEELVRALRQTLGCPFMTEAPRGNRRAARNACLGSTAALAANSGLITGAVIPKIYK
ncbi:MAG: vWA domain-containing protein [Hyphomicrobium sp.]